MRRIAVAIALAVSAAVAIGALHGGAATPSMQSVAVPDKSGQTVSVAWSGTIPAASPHPTSDCNGAGVGQDDEGLTVATPRKGYDKFDATFTFKITSLCRATVDFTPPVRATILTENRLSAGSRLTNSSDSPE